LKSSADGFAAKDTSDATWSRDVSGSADWVEALEGLRWSRLFFRSLPSAAKRLPPSSAVFLNDPLRLRTVLLWGALAEPFSSFHSFTGDTTATSSSTLFLGPSGSFSREGGLLVSPPVRKKLSLEKMLPDSVLLCPCGFGGVMEDAGAAVVGDVGAEGELQGNFIFWKGGNSSFPSSKSLFRAGFSMGMAMVLRRALLPPPEGRVLSMAVPDASWPGRFEGGIQSIALGGRCEIGGVVYHFIGIDGMKQRKMEMTLCWALRCASNGVKRFVPQWPGNPEGRI
jgi:hypothetical protein